MADSDVLCFVAPTTKRVLQGLRFRDPHYATLGSGTARSTTEPQKPGASPFAELR